MDKFRAITDSVNPDLVLITGDLVRDALRVDEKEATRLYQLFATESGKIKSPLWLAPGNHEIFGIERHLSLVNPQNPLYGRNMYRHFFGPDYYSFNYGGVHFIALNSLEFEDLWYYGRIDSTQIEWLKKDLATINAAMPVVTFQHVPFYSGGMSMENFSDEGPGRSLEREHGVMQFRHVVSNADEVLAVLKPYNFVLSLAGHYHYRQHFSVEGINTRFEQAAAVIAPVTFSNYRSPSGVTLYTVANGTIDAGQFIPLDKK
jgi:3',5'-cyclic AMP phosphodiesterase CpdA